mmetsp:Transcript_3779/g.4630  ORF Transcript_3779/g.4630 Transcript_3779/m.4630 type:complete len:317 (+) Transcript_3779:118-1068(+)|eukprot:CAMPEP_0203670588 /NCGR_PEP_ID=MMETSP0090-20130426/6619_1 /ASSEMBLY_ACC=CAM_ASM_001088 /TAXON_ID=426623 /ORGANISM="Chaetoceros affinis, Strain CCMP159" /LENGTH=316 /DNA_ID=CAMNT_0050535479 /DNA_START=137 /DNA_END=1087 /DNA_ORIENTATION=+
MTDEGTEKQEIEEETTADQDIKKGEATFHARQSGRVGSSITTDHDTWVERLAVVDMLIPSSSRSGEAKYELQIRSFFESTKTGKKTWDEPPSGAENIEYANQEVRRMAEIQKSDIESISNNNANGGGSNGDGKVYNITAMVDATCGGRKGGFGKRVMRLISRSKRNLNDDTGENATNEENENKKNIAPKVIHYKKDSPMHNIIHEKSDLYYDPETDLEYALAISANDLQGKSEEDDDEMALATALSLSLKERASSPVVSPKNKLLSAYANFERSKGTEGGQGILSGYTEEEIAKATAKVDSNKVPETLEANGEVSD